MIDLYRKKPFSTRACRWYPDSLFQRRRPSAFTALIVRSRALERGGRAAEKEPRTRRRIDFSDIPEASAEQLRSMRRAGRPPIGERARQLIAIRVDPDVLKELRKEATRRNAGYQTLVNRVLADYYVRKHVA
jgi:uncharacterized protein (DUF4415 family)